jgi:hypothetical protein
MIYLIPRGTPIAMGQYGRSLQPHTTKRDLAFAEPLAASGEQLTFHDGYWQVVVARALVVAVSEAIHAGCFIAGGEGASSICF